MRLRVSLPEAVLLDVDGVRTVVAETVDGSLGILPQRLDCVALLLPGILSYATDVAQRHYVAVDAGVLVKAGEDVQVSARHALSGNDLAAMQQAVDDMLRQVDEEEREARVLLARMESGFIRQFRNLRHG
ncbi:MAG: F0F1 ATP synthase subunit epsilon [Betaproteobacteria bacterium]|nr:F0F1 ATP synthase subunit epsilon [Betaproteobacteria bacterium]